MSEMNISSETHFPDLRRQGVLMHMTSLPNQEGIGGLGSEAHRFLDWLKSSGATAWQMLPLVPIGAGYSPYSSSSAFAGNPLLISVVTLHEEGWLTSEELAQYQDQVDQWDLDKVHFPEVCLEKNALLQTAARRFIEQRGVDDETLSSFREVHQSWLEDAALFEAISSEVQLPWWQWPTTLRTRQEQTLAFARRRFADAINRYVVLQYWFQTQWIDLREAADRLGIELIGDVPIYVDHHSADVWSNPALFCLTDTGDPKAVSGVPPDAFSDTGQLWGSPLYDWDQHRETGFQWWVDRLRRSLELTHTVRIDHFRAFAAYWSIPYGSEDARSGEWLTGPGARIFDELNKALPKNHQGQLPLIAEDLGLIDRPVRDLLEATRLPGMKVLQFAFDGDVNNDYLPHNFTSTRSVIYTGTHDNQTSRGWWTTLDERSQDQVRRYCDCAGNPQEISWDLIRLALSSTAQLAIIPMQDLLSLGDDSRMNQPSLPEGNWSWRVRAEALNHDVSSRFRELGSRFGRI